VSFSTNQLPDAFQVKASVASFTSVTNNSVGFAVASALDRVLRNSTGDMSSVLGSFQQLTQSNFNKIYSGISGESYDHFRESSFNTMERYSGVMHSRMNQLRAAFHGMSILETIDRTQIGQDTMLAQYGSVPGALDLLDNGSKGQLPQRYGMWLSTFGQATAQKGDGGYSAFNYRTTGTPFGFDFALGNNLIAGLAAGQTSSRIIGEQAMGGTKGVFSTIYGTYFTRNAHVEGVVSYGRNQYKNTRVMNLGEEKRVAASRHDDQLLAGALEARYGFDFDDLKLEPFGSLHYGRLTEDSFRETGAGSLNLIVRTRQTESLTSQLGFRVVRLFSLDSGKLIPEFTAAWKHDFTANERPLSAVFAGAPDATFKLNGKETGKEGLQLGGALTFIGEKNFSASAGINAELGKNRQGVSGLAQFQYKW
jgi:outer membrane autotransporter protein